MKCYKVWCLLGVTRRKCLGGGVDFTHPRGESVVLEAKLNRVKRADFTLPTLEESSGSKIPTILISMAPLSGTYSASPAVVYCFVLFCFAVVY